MLRCDMECSGVENVGRGGEGKEAIIMRNMFANMFYSALMTHVILSTTK